MKEIVYSILLVSQFDKFNETVLGLLKSNQYSPITVLKSASEARRYLLERKVDILIVNTPLKDELGVNLCIDASYRHDVAVLIFASENIYQDVYEKTNEYGILTVSKPANINTFMQSLRLITSTKERLNITLNKSPKVSLEDRMKEIRTINEAKLLLIKNKGYDENSAHKWLEKAAMDLRVTKLDLALNIIKIYHKKDGE